jgi:hypothetical protein
MENLRKKNQAEILEIKSPFSQMKNTVEGHSNRQEQMQERISEPKDKIDIKEKTEELLVKQLKICEKYMHELSNSIKRPNLGIMDIEEGEEVQAKGIHNIVNKIITENFQNLKKKLHIQVEKASRTQNRLDQNRTTPFIIKTSSTKNRERILMAIREKKQITYKGKPIKITADFSTENLKAKGHGVNYLGT